MENKKTAVIYARQSSGADDFSASVETQIENCKALAEKEGIEIIGIFSDLNTSGKTYPEGAEKIAENDGAFQRWFNQQTGTKKFRAGLGSVMKLLPSVDFIIVDEMTRLYRPFRGSYLENYINNALTDNNVSVLQVKGGAIDLSKFDQSLITMLKNAINDEQIANQKKKSMQQLRKRKDSGYMANGGGKAFGTVYSPADGSIMIQEEFIPAIQFIFDEIEKYTPYLQIIQALNQNFKNLVSKSFYYTNIYHVVNNPIYCGYMFNSEGFLIENKQIKNPCISFDQWNKVKNLMQSKKGKPAKAKKNWLPFSGLLYCGNCGASLVSGTDKGRIFYYCMRGSNYLKDASCKASRLYVDTLYSAIKPLLIMALFASMDEAEQRAQMKAEAGAIASQMANLKLKQQGITDMYIKGLISLEDMEKNLQGIKAEISKLNEKAVKISHTPDEATQHLEALHKKFTAESFLDDELDKSTYEQLLKQVVKRIDVFADCIKVDTIYGAVNLPRMNKKLPSAELYINGKKELSCVIKYAGGEQITEFEKIKIIA